MDWALLRRLRFVNRWGVVPMVRTQNVAEHSFGVLWIYAYLHEEYKFPQPTFATAMRIAAHDDEEAIEGDAPGPSKGMPDASNADQEKCWLKIADYLEACMTIREDAALGNSTLSGIFTDACNRGQIFVERLREFGVDVHSFSAIEAFLWRKVDIHKHPGMRGVGP